MFLTAEIQDHLLYSGQVSVAGWGHTEPREEGDPSVMTNRLHEVELPIQEPDVCYRRYMNEFRPGSFCVG